MQSSSDLFESHLKSLRSALGGAAFEDPQLKEKNHLTTAEAEMRAADLSSVKYTLLLVLHKGVEYLGYMSVDFNLAKVNEKLFLDFEGTEVIHCGINETEVAPKEVFAKRRIQIPGKYQKVGENTVRIAFRNRYAVDGNGLHHFMDPEDKEEYLYSNFEPFAANKMLPCFDQPNLKGTLLLFTITPAHWVVIGNELEKSTIAVGEAAKRLEELRIPAAFISKELADAKYNFKEFATVPAISTYLFACIAGPYGFFTSPRKPEEGYPPMKIYMRKSLQKYVEPFANEFFRITECGISFYSDIFGYKYPFSKLDQIYCPEYNIGAMENVGAVTYSERYVFKDPPTEGILLRFAETILHELSHMWFGDLVTMKWWNDLWLNESFATFISNLCLAKGSGLERYEAVWTAFHKYKGWAYREDQQPTTHPITAKIENTEDADNLFDGITYMKGSSVLKQLYYLVSHEAFCDGVKEYFQVYQWKNTELRDFIGVLQKALKKHGSSIDLDKWVQEWLCTKGLNELQPKFEVKDGVIAEFKVLQSEAPNADKVCRMHMMDIALYDKDFNLTTVERVLVESKPETTIEKIKGMEAPVAVLLNVNDYSYSKVRLDIDSMHAFQKNLSKIKDNLTRMMIWRSYWDMVRDGLTSAEEFLKLVTAQLHFENEESIVSGALGYSLSAATFYVPKEQREAEEMVLYKTLETRLKMEKMPNIKKLLVSYLINFAVTVDQKKLLIKWLNEGMGDYSLSLDQRYAILQKIYADANFPLEEKQKLLAKELEKDKSDNGLRAQRACEAAIPAVENKEKHWKILLDEDTKESEHTLFAIMSGFNSRHQEELLKPYAEKYYCALPAVFEKRSRRYAEAFFNHVKPLDEDEETLKRFEEISKTISEDQKTFKKVVMEEIEDIKRVLKARALYKESIKKPQ
eukprot:TRINITY_DN6110_c0_g1_i5.p1 TRINITY_DN6110_c0_g1~~TRINITY_DN6110_c0_g1_i5.p1  ORF type:complete len:916 (-),score=330.64 TRINITY_DN6110_c0_g1_i5:132-2879(-)